MSAAYRGARARGIAGKDQTWLTGKTRSINNTTRPQPGSPEYEWAMGHLYKDYNWSKKVAHRPPFNATRAELSAYWKKYYDYQARVAKLPKKSAYNYPPNIPKDYVYTPVDKPSESLSPVFFFTFLLLSIIVAIIGTILYMLNHNYAIYILGLLAILIPGAIISLLVWIFE